MNGRDFKVGQKIKINPICWCPDPMPRTSRWGNRVAEITQVELYKDRLGWIHVQCDGEILLLDEREVIEL